MLVQDMKRTVLFPLFLGLLLVVVGVMGSIVPSYFEESENPRNARLRKFTSYEELKSFLNAGSKTEPYDGYEGFFLNPVNMFGMRDESAYTTSTAPGYSTTNVQVEDRWGIHLHNVGKEHHNLKGLSSHRV